MRKLLWKGITEEERQLVGSVIVFLAIPLALIALIPSMVGIYLVNQESKNRAAAIQSNRAEITYTTCLATNERHRATEETLDKILEARRAVLLREKKTATSLRKVAIDLEITRLEASRRTTILLIDALVPRVDCEAVVMERFGYVPQVNGDR